MAEAICVIEDDVSVGVDEATPLLASQQRSYLKEQVWEEIFQEKCAITVQQNEILHVKDNVESFVSKVIQRALNSDTYQNFISAVDKKDLIQFNEQCSEENLLQIGSFYEGTKNSYPNEFDFIFVLTEYSAKDYTRLQKLTSDLSDLFHEELKNVISGLSLKLDKVFEQFSLSGQHGPASRIKLVFKEAAALRERIVYLDISAASRWHFETCLPKEIEVCCKEWIEMILETGSALVIKVYKADHPKHKTEVKITITETEQNFVRHAMTENHRKVYRLLKYVFNGNDGANETLKMLIRRPDNTHTSSIAFIGKKVSPKIVYDLPSYTIKTLIFDHVHRCRNAEEGIAECLTEVLKSLLAKFDGTKCVSVKTMLRQPLEITDDSLSTEAVGMKLSILLKTAENVEQTREMMRAGLEKQIPFTEQQIDTVETVLTLKGCILGYSRVLLLTVPAIIGIILLTIIGISGQLCVVSPTYSSNKSIDVQYCCIGTKGISERWRNVTCSKSNIFSRHSDDIAESMSVGLEKAFACMALTAAKNADVGNGDVYYAWNDVALCSENVSKITEEAKMCLYCNVSVEDPRDNEVFLPTQNQDSLCSYIAPCRHDELGKQVNSFLKIKALTFNDVHMHAFSNCDTENISADANCTSYPFQTCTENTTSDGRTELCCSTSEIVSIDECENRWFFWIVSGVSVTLYVCGIVMCCLSAEIRRKIILRRMWQRMINETETASYR